MNVMHKFNVFSFCIFIYLCNVVIQAKDIDFINAQDEYGRTPLINFIQEQDAELALLRKKVSFILSCDISCDKNGDIIYAKKQTTLDRLDIDQKRFDKEIEHWKPYKIKYDFIIKKIKEMIVLGADLTLHDHTGKTVIDYCCTKEVYNFLRDSGATFQVIPWIYFNSDKIFIVSFVCCGLSIFILKEYQDHKNREFLRNLALIHPINKISNN